MFAHTHTQPEFPPLVGRVEEEEEEEEGVLMFPRGSEVAGVKSSLLMFYGLS